MVVPVDTAVLILRMFFGHSEMREGAMGKAQRWISLSGIAFVLVTFIGLSALGDTPVVDDVSADVIVDHWLEVADGNLAAALIVLAVPLLVLFGGAVLVWYDRAADEGFNVWTFLFGVGVAVMAAGFLVGSGLSGSVADAADNGFTESVVTLHAALMRSHVVWATGLALLLLGAAGLFIPRSGFIRILGWVGLVGGILGLLPDPAGFVGTLIGVLWIVAISIALTRTA